MWILFVCIYLPVTESIICKTLIFPTSKLKIHLNTTQPNDAFNMKKKVENITRNGTPLWPTDATEHPPLVFRVSETP